MKTLREYIDTINELAGEPPLYPNYQQLPGPQSTAVAAPKASSVATTTPPRSEKLAGSGSTTDMRSKLPGTTGAPAATSTASKAGGALSGAGIGAAGGVQTPGTIQGSPTAATAAGFMAGGAPGAAAALGSWGATRAATRGADSRIGTWGDTPAQQAEKAKLQAQKPTGTPPTPTTAKANPADFDKWRQNPTLSQLANKPAQTPTSAALPATSAPAQPAQAPSTTAPGKWPTSKQEIIAYQKANGLKPDGLLGWRTEQALIQQGIQPPAGFKPVSDRPQAAATAPGKAAPQGGQPAQGGQPSWYEPEDVARDERIQQLLHPQAAATAPGQTYAQAQTAKQDLSKDMAAATGIQNPYATTAQAGMSAPQPASPGSNFDASGRILPPETPQKKGGVTEFKESNDELTRIITLANLNKN